MLSEEMQEAARAFVRTLLEAPAVGGFVQTERAFQTDGEVRVLRERVARLAEQFQTARATGNLSESLVAQVRDAQGRLQSHPMVMVYGRKRQEAFALLQEINARMSGILGIDFAAVARPPSTCC